MAICMWVFYNNDFCLKLKPIQLRYFVLSEMIAIDCRYSRTSVARELMAPLPRLFRTRSGVPRKKVLCCRFGIIKCDFLFILKSEYCVYSLESPH